jgi:hypothetical protein
MIIGIERFTGIIDSLLLSPLVGPIFGKTGRGADWVDFADWGRVSFGRNSRSGGAEPSIATGFEPREGTGVRGYFIASGIRIGIRIGIGTGEVPSLSGRLVRSELKSET